MPPKQLEPENEKEQALWKAFQKFDANGDGKIQENEFKKLMKSLGNFSDKEIKRLFAEADLDSSGGVDWREFIKWICSGAAGKNLSADSAASFSRLLKYEARDEASFVEQASVSKQLTAYLKEASSAKTEAEMELERKRKQTKIKKQKAQEKDTHGSKAVTAESIGIDESYTGYRLPIPCTSEGAAGLMNHYLAHPNSNALHPKYVNYLTTTFTSAYRARHPKPVVTTDTPRPGRLIVVGDTHGQLADVLHILHSLGPPTPSNRYLFNGDMVDRGQHGVEILLILFAFFLADPESVIIHRGNHENEDMNALHCDSGGGFVDEVMRKYGLSAYRRFVSAFKALSLCAVVEKEIFVVHGGLSRVSGMSIDYINTIDHTEVTAPHPQAAEVKDQVFSDLVWSDPTNQGGKYKSDRGIGIKFGQDITTKFCMQNRLRFVIRSHQVPDDGRGYMKQHEGRCVTIFSASNYCGDTGNYGAVLVLDSEHFPRYEIIEHYAPPLEDMPRILGVGLDKLCIEQQKEKSDAATEQLRSEREFERMIIGVIDKKPALWSHIVDMGLRNDMEMDDWKELMCDMVDPTLPWEDAAKQKGFVNSAGKIEIDKFLSRCVVELDSDKYKNFLSLAVKHVYEAIMALDMDLDKTMKMFDMDGDGTVDIKEMRHVLGMFDLGLTGTQLDRLTGRIFAEVCRDATAKGEDSSKAKLNVQDFLGRFTVVYKASASSGSKSAGDDIPAWTVEALGALGKLIISTPADELVSDMEKAAVKIQKIFRGTALRKDMKKEEESKKNGQAPAVSPRTIAGGGASAPSSAAAPAGGAAFNSNSLESKMVRLFKAMDASGDGILQLDEFVNGLMMVPGINSIQGNGKPLAKEGLTEIAKVIDSDGNSNGTINYLEFLQAFEPGEDSNGDIANSLAEDITTVLFRSRMAIRMGCQYFDEDGSGKVRADELQKVLHGVNSVLARPQRMLTSPQISFLVEALKEENGDDAEDYVDYDAFLRAFVILDTAQDNSVVKRF